MANKLCSCLGNVLGSNTGNNCQNDKSTCIDVDKIYDAAKDKECIEDLKVYVNACGQEIIDSASTIRCTGAEVVWAQISVHDIAFNRGYFSVDIRYYFRICFEACVSGNAREFCGIAVYDKQTILFGSEGNVSIFTSEAVSGNVCAGVNCQTLTQTVSNMPKVVLEVATPICLSVKSVEKCYNYGCCCCGCEQVPQSITDLCGCAGLCDDSGVKALYVTLGLFTLIRIERPVSILLENAQFCVPERQSAVLSDSTTNDPCSIFNNMDFPTCDFFPPSFGAISGGIAGGEQCTECPPENVLGDMTESGNDDCDKKCHGHHHHHNDNCGSGNNNCNNNCNTNCNTGCTNGNTSCRPCRC